MSEMKGRPTIYTQEIADKICNHIAGGDSLRSICRQDEMPHHSTVLLWVVDNRDGFYHQYTRAREAAGYAHADGLVEIIAMLRSGDIDPNTAKAVMDGQKWVAERMAPKSHSAKQEIAHTSPDGSFAPTTIRIVAAGEPVKESAE